MWQAKMKNCYEVHSTAHGSQIHSLHSLHVMLVWLYSVHTGLQHIEQHFATFLSLNAGHKKHRFLFCKVIPVCKSVLERPKPHRIVASFVALWSWGIFCLVIIWGMMRLSARSVRKRRRLEQWPLRYQGILVGKRYKHLVLRWPAHYKKEWEAIGRFVFCRCKFEPFNELGQHQSWSRYKTW